jgi:hypothetical protein
MHRAGVAPTMKRDIASAQGRTNSTRLFDGQGEPARGLAPRDGFELAVSEDRLRSSDLVVSAPSLDFVVGLTPERHSPLLPSLPAQTNHAVFDVGGSDLKGFRDSGACIVEKSKEQMVTPSRPCRSICGREDGLDLRPTEKAEQRFIRAFAWDGEDPLSLVKEFGCKLVHRKTNECAKGSQSRIAGAGGIVAFFLQMFQKRKDRFGAKGLKSNPINRSALLFGDEM